MSIELRCWASNFIEWQWLFQTYRNRNIISYSMLLKWTNHIEISSDELLSGRLFVYMCKHDFALWNAWLRSKNVECALAHCVSWCYVHWSLPSAYKCPFYGMYLPHIFHLIRYILFVVQLFQLLRIFGQCLKQKTM